MPDEINVQVRFTLIDDNGNDFTDALYYPIAEWPIPTEQLDSDKRERLSVHNAAVSATAPSSDELGPEA